MPTIKPTNNTVAVEIAEMRKDIEYLKSAVEKILNIMEQQQSHVFECEKKNDMRYVHKQEIDSLIRSTVAKIEEETISRTNSKANMIINIAKIAGFILSGGLGFWLIQNVR